MSDLTFLLPELHLEISKWLDLASKVSLSLSARMFIDLETDDHTKRFVYFLSREDYVLSNGIDICVECIKAQHLELFRYWFLEVKVCVQNPVVNGGRTERLIGTAAQIIGGRTHGEKAITAIKYIASAWIDRLFLIGCDVIIDKHKLAWAAVLPDDVEHYKALTIGYTLTGKRRTKVIFACLEHGGFNMLDFLYQPSDIQSINEATKFLAKAARFGSRMVRWVVAKCQHITLPDGGWELWKIIFDLVGCDGYKKIIDVMEDRILFPGVTRDKLRVMLQDSPFHSYAEAILSVVKEFPDLPLGTENIMWQLVKMIENTEIKNLLLRTYSSRDIHRFAIRVGCDIDVVCRVLPLKYDIEMAVELVKHIIHDGDCPSLCETLKDTIGEVAFQAFEIIWRGEFSSQARLQIMSLFIRYKLLTAEKAVALLGEIDTETT